MPHLGRRVQCELKPGLAGTVVHCEEAIGRWPRSAPTFDVLWDDMSTSRRVAQSLIEGEGWRFLEEPRVPSAECNRRWYDYLVARTKEMAAAHAAAAQRPAPPMFPGLSSPAGVGGMAAAVQGIELRSPNGRAVAQRARELLGERIPGCSFAVNCERRVLTVSWLDGPVAGGVWRCLAAIADGRSVDRIRLKRGLTEPLVQAAVNYCLWRVHGADHAAIARSASRVTAGEYLSGGLENVRAESGDASGVPYQTLIRVVVDRWDDARGRFVATRSTAGLLRELQAMFPLGDAAAGGDFESFRAAVTADQQAGQRLIDDMRGLQRQA